MAETKMRNEKMVQQLLDEVNKINIGVLEAKKHFSGEVKLEEEITFSEKVDVKKIRAKIKMSQDEFAKAAHLNVSTIRNWEQGVRTPEQPAKILLALLEKFPDEMLKKIKSLNFVG